MIQTPETVHEIGRFEADDVYHGTYEEFDQFSDEYLASVGFHFGDLPQAKYFATKRGPGGRIIQAQLVFNNLVDIGKDDWGWIDCKRGALQCYMKFNQSGISLDEEVFTTILGPKPWNNATFPITQKMSAEERLAFANLLRAHNFDGVRYTNNYEPPQVTGGLAYFVLDAAQITIVSTVPLGQ